MKHMTELKIKLQHVVDFECKYADRDGSSKLSTANAQNWDKDIWAYKGAIMKAIKNRGYNVSASVKWGVTDIVTTCKLDLN